jgi:hypothetical protein
LDQFEALYDLYRAQFGDEEGHRRFRRVIERFEEDRQQGEERKEGENQQAAKRGRPGDV